MGEVPATIRELAADRASGAAEIAGRAARELASVPRDRLGPSIEALLRGHPSMAQLWRLATAVLEDPGGAGRFLEDLAADRGAAEVLAGVLPDTVLTISRSSTVIEALRLRRPRVVLCMRSEPGGEGGRTAAALAGAGADARVLDDEEALATIPADAVVVGADAVTPEHLVNKVRTGALCEAAAARGVPSYAAGGRTKLVSADLPVQGLFERVSLQILAGVAMPAGLLTPDEAGAAATDVPLHPSLLALLAELRGR